jgi:hypothetical protein
MLSDIGVGTLSIVAGMVVLARSSFPVKSVFFLDFLEQKENNLAFGSRGRTMTDSDTRSDWLRQLDEECPYQVVLPRQQLCDDSVILNFLIDHVGNFDMYVEDEYAAFVRYCFEDPLDAEIFRARFEPKADRFKLAG